MLSKFFTSIFFSILLAFVVGGISTYFITDYIRLKNNENISSVRKSIEISKPKISQNKTLKQDDWSDLFTLMDKIHNQMQKCMNKTIG